MIINIYGDWGLGIGDCPIPNPQSPIPSYDIEIQSLNLLVNN